MTAREVKLWKMACPALAVAAFAADALLMWWLQAWEYAPSDRKGKMLFDVLAAGLFLFSLGTYLLSRAMFDFKRARASMRWPTLQGRVLTRGAGELRTWPVQVHYNPEYPQLAVLQSASQRPLRTILSGALLFVIPFVVAWSRYLGW
jgi:hypothetical protein